LYPKAPTRFRRRAVLLQRGVGHHWVPFEVVTNLTSFISEDARKAFKGETTGPGAGVIKHRNDTVYVNGVRLTHPDYNKRVNVKLSEYITRLRTTGQLTGGKLNRDQALKFVEMIKRNGAGDQRIYDYNQGVIQRLRMTRLAQMLAASLVTEFASATTVMARSKNFKRAVAALKKGDIAEADNALLGDDRSLYQELLDENLRDPALNLRNWWPEARRRAMEGELRVDE
jgi:hypothetical protein